MVMEQEIIQSIAYNCWQLFKNMFKYGRDLSFQWTLSEFDKMVNLMTKLVSHFN